MINWETPSKEDSHIINDLSQIGEFVYKIVLDVKKI